MGAGRDLTFAVFAEAVLLLVVVLAALPAGAGTDLTAMSDAAAGEAIWREPAHWCAALAFVLVALTEAGRQPVDNPDTHLAELREHLQFCEQVAREVLAGGGDEQEMESKFVARIREEMLRRLSPADMDGYELAGRFDLNWRGLVRALRKKGAAGPPSAVAAKGSAGPP